MSVYDILMLIAFGGAIFFGYWKGLAWQIASLASVIVSYLVACNFHGVISPYIDIGAPWNKFAAMLVLFLGTSLIIWIGFGYVRHSIDKMKLSGFDHQSGAILGAVKGVLLCMLITLFSVTLLPDSFSSSVINSRSGNFIARSINQLSSMVPEELHAVLEPRLNSMNQTFAEHGKNPTTPITIKNRDGWFEGTVVVNSENPADSNVPSWDGQFQTQSGTQSGSGQPVQEWFQEEMINRGIESIGRGISGQQNR